MIKNCYRCKKDLDASHFYKSSKSVDGLQHLCKKCRKHDDAKHWKGLTGDSRRDKKYRAKYGLSLVGYNELLESQDYKCAICKTRKPGEKNKHLVVDHCHKTGKVRGLLCQSCNVGLGYIEKMRRNLSLVFEYLDRDFSDK